MTTTDRNTETKSRILRASRKPSNESSPHKTSAKPSKQRLAGEPARSRVQPKRVRAASGTAAVAVGPHTKKEVCLSLLRRPGGASLEELKRATGWQPHSVRGFLSGEVRKRMDGQLSSEADAGGKRRYRLVETAAAS
jgi:hypothetical protein